MLASPVVISLQCARGCHRVDVQGDAARPDRTLFRGMRAKREWHPWPVWKIYRLNLDGTLAEPTFMLQREIDILRMAMETDG